MKKLNKKGFTIVELVIVIAVIAILAGVLIPTFAGITNKAKNNAALQEARNIYTVYVSQVNAQVEDEVYVKVEDKTFKVVKGQMEAEPIKTTPSTGIWVEKADEDTVTISCVATCADANIDNKCDVCGYKLPVEVPDDTTTTTTNKADDTTTTNKADDTAKPDENSTKPTTNNDEPADVENTENLTPDDTTEPTENINVDNNNNDNDDNKNSVWLIIGIILVLVAGTVVVVVLMKKKKDNK